MVRRLSPVTEGLSTHTLVIELEDRGSLEVLLERFRAPLIVEQIVNSLPQISRMYVSADNSYAYIPLSLGRTIGIASRTAGLKRGDVGFMPLNQSMIICLKDFRARHPLILIGRIKDESSLKLLKGLTKSLRVVLRSLASNL